MRRAIVCAVLLASPAVPASAAEAWSLRLCCPCHPDRTVPCHHATSDEMLYMVIERFRDGNPAPIYRRFREKGRLAPLGLQYVNSWVTDDLRACYQVMECDDRRLLDEWMSNWSDIVDFEVHPVVTSAEASGRVS